MYEQFDTLSASLFELRTVLIGDEVLKSKVGSTLPSIMSRVGGVIYGHWDTTELPTATHMRTIALAQSEFENYLKEASEFFSQLADFERQLEEVGAPYTPNRWMD